MVGVLVRDKIQAKQLQETLFRRGYKITPGSLTCENHEEIVRIVPMDPKDKDISYRMNGFLFDEIHLPSYAKKEWVDLAQSRLKDESSTMKIY